MRHQWIAAEHHRLHTVEEWPEGPHKEATLRAIHSALATLAQDTGGTANFPGCEVCLSRRRGSATVVRFPAPAELAA